DAPRGADADAGLGADAPGADAGPAGFHPDEGPRPERGRIRAAALPILGTGVLCAVGFGVAFLILNPYSVVDFHAFRHQVAGQSATAGGSAKLGQSNTPGWLYYMWTVTWGLGWVPAVAALGGAVVLLRANWRRGL